MNPEIKKLWIDALTSGEYKQTKSQLYKDNCYCCLGVLCDLHAKATKTTSFNTTNEYLGNKNLLPDEVMEWANLSKNKGNWNNPIVGYITLSKMNDRGNDFHFIAQQIEKYL